MANAPVWTTHQFSIILAVIQVIFIIIFAIFSTHKPGALPGGVPELEHQINYTDFQDIHVTLIVGLGFLVAFLRRYGFASFGISLLLTAFTIEWALILRGFLSPEISGEEGKFYISIYSLVRADFTAAVVLISFGALIGKLSPVQYLVLAFLETPAAIACEFLILHRLQIQDVGGAVFVHVFGAVFGIVASRVLYKQSWAKSDDAASVYHSEVISFVGAAFLWVFWPSFNAVNTVGDARYRAIVNSYVALVASTVAAFLASQFLHKERTFNIRHIVSASLAGGVALGASANILLAPFHAIIVGTVAGIVSILSFKFVAPAILKYNVHDTRGVFSIHALPGIVGSLASAIFLFLYSNDKFPPATKIVASERNNTSQALFQLAGLGVGIGIAVIAGAITGLILNLKCWNSVKELFSDTGIFETPDDFDFTTRVLSHIDRVEVNEAPKTKPIPNPILNPEQVQLTSQTTTTAEVDETAA